MKYFILLTLLFFSNAGFSQKVLYKDVILHVGNGMRIDNALVGCDDDRFIMVKNALTSSYKSKNWDTIISLEGKHMYPAFVASNTTLGLTEIDAVRATRDFDDVGEFNPHVRTQIAFNTESRVSETVRTNGVLLTQATPRGGRVSGTSSVMRLFAWNWEDATVLKDDGIHLNWPNSIQGGGWWAEPKSKERNKNYSKEIVKLEQFFQLAFAYDVNTSKFDQRLQAMKGCFTGLKRLYIHANELQQIHDIIDFVNVFKFPFPVIVGGYDAHLVGKKLKDSKIPVMLDRIHGLPQIEDEATDLPYRIPALLNRQGIQFCLQGSGDMEAMNSRNLPFLAGTAMAYGLDEEAAVASISLAPCEIIGIAKDYGSVEKGKKASFFVSEGNALDMMTNKVTLICLDGVLQSTSNFQLELYERYKAKYEKQ